MTFRQLPLYHGQIHRPSTLGPSRISVMRLPCRHCPKASPNVQECLFQSPISVENLANKVAAIDY
jgi:hypothetical protein